MKQLISILALAALACGMSAGMTPAVPADPTTTSAPPRSAPVKPTSTQQPKQYEVYRAGYLYVRAGAGMNNGVLASLKDGEVVTLLGKSGSWWKIEAPGGTVGWVNSYYLRIK
jgi:uncharacterized protein YgiM (DUF1202 family)